MRLKKISLSIATALLGAGMMFSAQAEAKGRLVVYCSATNILCETSTKAFGEKYDVKTSFIRNGSGSTFAKVEAEKNNPQADVWFGGTFDPQAQAAELGLLQAYRSPNVDQIVERFQDPAKTKGNYASAIYMGILGFGVNTERLKKLGINEVPKCWKDLTDPRLKGEIQIADPQSSGTAYTAIATFVQLWDEQQAFDYFKKLHPNVSQYTKSGIAPSRNAARGETAIGIGFLHDYALEKQQGALASRRHRSHPRRRLQPQRRRRTRQRHALPARHRQQPLLLAQQRRTRRKLVRLRQRHQRQPPAHPEMDHRRLALLGGRMPRGRLPLRSRQHPCTHPRL